MQHLNIYELAVHSRYPGPRQGDIHNLRLLWRLWTIRDSPAAVSRSRFGGMWEIPRSPHWPLIFVAELHENVGYELGHSFLLRPYGDYGTSA